MDGKLYVSNFTAGKIHVFDITTMTEVCSWNCENPTRLTVDDRDNIYTGCTYGTFWCNCIEKWDSTGALQWRLFAGTSLDCAGTDPDNETDLYSKYHHYTLDYSKQCAGTEWSLRGLARLLRRNTFASTNKNT